MVLSTFGTGGPRDLGTMEQWFDQLLGPGVLFTRGSEAPLSSFSRLREKLGLRLENFHPGIEDRHHQTLNQLHPRLEDDGILADVHDVQMDFSLVVFVNHAGSDLELVLGGNTALVEHDEGTPPGYSSFDPGWDVDAFARPDLFGFEVFRDVEVQPGGQTRSSGWGLDISYFYDFHFLKYFSRRARCVVPDESDALSMKLYRV